MWLFLEEERPEEAADINSTRNMASEVHKEAWKQQNWSALYSPILTSGVVKTIFSLVGVTFIVLGGFLLSETQGVVEQSVRYDNDGQCETDITMGSSDLPKICTKSFEIKDDMELPVYFYYELNGFYQNHRDYIKSYSFAQITEKDLHDTTELDACSPLDTYESMQIYPCGLIANSFFSDRFTMTVNGETLCPNCNIATDDWNTTWSDWYDDNMWKRDGIAWQVDVDKRYKWNDNWEAEGATRQGWLQRQQGLDLPMTTDEDYMVWARTAAMPNFRKLHRVIDNLPSGADKLGKGDTIEVTIANWFSVMEFDGQKKFVLTTLSYFGGPMNGLAIGYLIVGVASVLMVIGIIIAEQMKWVTSELGDYTKFPWENLQVEH